MLQRILRWNHAELNSLGVSIDTACRDVDSHPRALTSTVISEILRIAVMRPEQVAKSTLSRPPGGGRGAKRQGSASVAVGYEVQVPYDSYAIDA